MSLNKYAVQFLIVWFFAISACKHENTLAPPDNQPKEITWQQSGLDSLRVTVLAANATGDVLLHRAEMGYSVRQIMVQPGSS